jgi:hypothetical protein
MVLTAFLLMAILQEVIKVSNTVSHDRPRRNPVGAFDDTGLLERRDKARIRPASGDG